jgi:ATP-dependent Lon protease
LGLIRLSIRHGDGTAHVALQGIARVVLAETLRYRPYRLCRIEPLETPACNVVVVDALLSRMRELLQERLELGAPEHFPKLVSSSPDNAPAGLSAKDALTWVDKLTSHSDPGHVTDLVSSEILARPRERQTILETINLEERLRCLIHFLMAEIQQERKNKQR